MKEFYSATQRVNNTYMRATLLLYVGNITPTIESVSATQIYHVAVSIKSRPVLYSKVHINTFVYLILCEYACVKNRKTSHP